MWKDDIKEGNSSSYILLLIVGDFALIPPPPGTSLTLVDRVNAHFLDGVAVARLVSLF